MRGWFVKHSQTNEKPFPSWAPQVYILRWNWGGWAMTTEGNKWNTVNSLELNEQVHELRSGTEMGVNIKFTDSWVFPHSLLPQTQKWTLKRILRLLNKQERRAQVILYTPQIGSLSAAWIFSVMESHTMSMSLGRQKWGKCRVPCAALCSEGRGQILTCLGKNSVSWFL